MLRLIINRSIPISGSSFFSMKITHIHSSFRVEIMIALLREFRRRAYKVKLFLLVLMSQSINISPVTLVSDRWCYLPSIKKLAAPNPPFLRKKSSSYPHRSRNSFPPASMNCKSGSASCRMSNAPKQRAFRNWPSSSVPWSPAKPPATHCSALGCCITPTWRATISSARTAA